jgi:hypothetical protein
LSQIAASKDREAPFDYSCFKAPFDCQGFTPHSRLLFITIVSAPFDYYYYLEAPSEYYFVSVLLDCHGFTPCSRPYVIIIISP